MPAITPEHEFYVNPGGIPPVNKIGLGTLRLPINKRQYVTVTGGPFRDRPLFMYSVKLAEEINAYSNIDLPIKDFSIPNRKALHRVLEEVVRVILSGERVYIGCAGGRGRTGLFLAILAKTFGIRSPIKYVRENYFIHAVETKSQEEFVKYFRPTLKVKKDIKRFRRTAWMKFWRKNLTHASR